MNRFKNQGLYLSGTGRLLSYNTAKLAKEKGFDPEALSIYYDPPKKGIVVGQGSARKYNYYKDKPKDGIERVHNTIQSVLQQWLREVHKINVSSDLWGYLGKKQLSTYQYNILKISPDSDYIKSHKPKSGTTYEEALEIGLQEALKLIK